MFDCIYRDEVKQKIKERMRCLDDVRILNKGDAETLKQIERFKKVLNQICCDIDDIRTADVQPVKHGKWKHVAGMNSKCSVCSHYFPATEFDSRPFDINYCPNCGARMDLKEGDAE